MIYFVRSYLFVQVFIPFFHMCVGGSFLACAVADSASMRSIFCDPATLVVKKKKKE